MFRVIPCILANHRANIINPKKSQSSQLPYLLKVQGSTPTLLLSTPKNVCVTIFYKTNKSFRLYYNQATPDGNGDFKFVNWYDGNKSSGVYRSPFLPTSASVYKNFEGRILRVPVIHVNNLIFQLHLNKINLNNLFPSHLHGFLLTIITKVSIIGITPQTLKQIFL